MALSSNQTAYMTARAGAGRAGAIRAAFVPRYTQGNTPGSAGPRYTWERQYPTNADSWTITRL